MNEAQPDSNEHVQMGLQTIVSQQQATPGE